MLANQHALLTALGMPPPRRWRVIGLPVLGLLDKTGPVQSGRHMPSSKRFLLGSQEQFAANREDGVTRQVDTRAIHVRT